MKITIKLSDEQNAAMDKICREGCKKAAKIIAENMRRESWARYIDEVRAMEAAWNLRRLNQEASPQYNTPKRPFFLNAMATVGPIFKKRLRAILEDGNGDVHYRYEKVERVST